uniref:pre-peptidase C-terminal domain-containing protein n=1 Tax=Flavobacterium sp. TaxID=239 RepID=UPI003753257C
MVKLLLNVLFNKGKLKIILILIIFILTPLISFAQGTTCATATPITINGACATGTISDTTQDLPNIGTCSGTFRSEGWYTFNVTGGPLNLNISGTMGANNRDLFLELISSSNNTCTGTLNQIACANSFNTNPQTEVINTTLSNGTYFIKVVNVGSNASMSLTSLCVTSNTGPPNATCATATTLPCATSNLAGTTVGTSSIINGTACSMGDYGVWYTFVGDGNNTTISSTAAFDHEMSVSSGSCGSFTS